MTTKRYTVNRSERSARVSMMRERLSTFSHQMVQSFRAGMKNRIYTDSEYKRKNSQHPIGTVTFWVSYAVIEKDKLQGFDLSEQKEEIYGR